MGRIKLVSVFEGILLTGVLLLSVGAVWSGSRQFYYAAYPAGYSKMVLEQSQVQQLPPSLLYAVIRTESGFNPDAQSSVQARGLMQITKDTFEWAQMRTGEKEPLHFDDLYESGLNIRYGSAILRLLLDEFGSETNALCAYHAGWGKTKEWLANKEYAPNGVDITTIPYGDTKRYVAKVLDTKRTYEALYHIS